MFGGFWSTVLIVPVLLAVLASPLFYMARKKGRTDTFRRFAIGGGVVTVFAAGLAYVSDRQVEQCFEAGNPSCVDAGTSGMQLIIVGGYIVVAWWVAFVLRDH